MHRWQGNIIPDSGVRNYVQLHSTLRGLKWWAATDSVSSKNTFDSQDISAAKETHLHLDWWVDWDRQSCNIAVYGFLSHDRYTTQLIACWYSIILDVCVCWDWETRLHHITLRLTHENRHILGPILKSDGGQVETEKYYSATLLTHVKEPHETSGPQQDTATNRLQATMQQRIAWIQVSQQSAHHRRGCLVQAHKKPSLSP